MLGQSLRHCLRLATFHLGATPRWATESLAGPLVTFLRGCQLTSDFVFLSAFLPEFITFLVCLGQSQGLFLNLLGDLIRQQAAIGQSLSLSFQTVFSLEISFL